MKTIPLTKGYVALVDDEDYDDLVRYNWCVNVNRNAVYARRAIPSGLPRRQIEVKMHSVIMGAPKGAQVDHIDGNGLNNQKANLRVVTNRQNCMNRHHKKTSRYPGVTWDKRGKKWVAQAQINGIHVHIGTFPTEDLAYQSYLARVCPLEQKIMERVNYVSQEQ